ncbi:MAG TPA: glycosyltransferase [Steroidobacteraceae bacterium]|jgi:glycosyltransferase involved in cell wall biosynthesis
MKLGYLLSQYPAVSHTFVLREVLTLRSQGVDVCVVSVRRCDRSPDRLSADEAAEARRTFSVMGAGFLHALISNARVLLRHPLGYLRGLLYAWSLTRGTPRLVVNYTAYFLEAVVAGDYFERHGVTDIHTHFSSTVLLILAQIFPVRYSLTAHGSGEFVDVVGFHLAEKVSGASFVATVGQYGMSQVMNASDPQHWHKVVALPLGVDPDAFPPRTNPVRTAGAPFRLISVGRLSAPKGYPVLIEAVALLRARGRNVDLTLVGEGPERAALEPLIALRGLGNCVHLAGACNHDRVAEYYEASDAFVLSSFLEGVPVVLMEAMAMELPCVATWITGIPEIIESGVDGLLVPPASAGAIADAVERLIDDPQHARQLGVAARQKVLAKYHLGRNVERLAEEFRARLATAT